MAMFNQPRTQQQHEQFAALRKAAIHDGLVIETLAEKMESQPQQIPIGKLYQIIRNESEQIPNLTTIKQMDDMYRTDYEVALAVKQQKQSNKQKMKEQKTDDIYKRLYDNKYQQLNQSRKEMRQRVQELNKYEQKQEMRKVKKFTSVDQNEKQIQIHELKMKYLQTNIKEKKQITDQYQIDIKKQLSLNSSNQVKIEFANNKQFEQVKLELNKLDGLYFQNIDKNMNNNLYQSQTVMNIIRQKQMEAEQIIRKKVINQKDNMIQIIKHFKQLESSTTFYLLRVEKLQKLHQIIKADYELYENINKTFQEQNFKLHQKIQDYKLIFDNKITQNSQIDAKLISTIDQLLKTDLFQDKQIVKCFSETRLPTVTFMRQRSNSDDDIQYHFLDSSSENMNNSKNEISSESQISSNPQTPPSVVNNFQLRPYSANNASSFLMTQNYQLEKQLQNQIQDDTVIKNQRNVASNLSNWQTQMQIQQKPDIKQVQKITKDKQNYINSNQQQTDFINLLLKQVNEQLVVQINDKQQLIKYIKYKKFLNLILEALKQETLLLTVKDYQQLQKIANNQNTVKNQIDSIKQVYNVEDDLVVFKANKQQQIQNNQNTQQQKIQTTSLISFLTKKK